MKYSYIASILYLSATSVGAFSSFKIGKPAGAKTKAPVVDVSQCTEIHAIVNELMNILRSHDNYLSIKS